jgi:hypothetical protein
VHLDDRRATCRSSSDITAGVYLSGSSRQQPWTLSVFLAARSLAGLGGPKDPDREKSSCRAVLVPCQEVTLGNVFQKTDESDYS